MNISQLKKIIKADTIEKEISSFENEVQLELVPVLATRSASIVHVPWMLQVLLTLVLLAAVESYYFFNNTEVEASLLVGVALISFLTLWPVSFFLSRFAFVQRLLSPERHRNQEVEQQAYQLFLQNRIFSTSTSNGVLLYVSMMEKRIIVLPDPRLKIDNLETLSQKVLELMKSHFKQNNFEQGFISAIQLLKSELKGHFPSNTMQKTSNELSNKLIWVGE